MSATGDFVNDVFQLIMKHVREVTSDLFERDIKLQNQIKLLEERIKKIEESIK